MRSFFTISQLTTGGQWLMFNLRDEDLRFPESLCSCRELHLRDGNCGANSVSHSFFSANKATCRRCMLCQVLSSSYPCALVFPPSLSISSSNSPSTLSVWLNFASYTCSGVLQVCFTPWSNEVSSFCRKSDPQTTLIKIVPTVKDSMDSQGLTRVSRCPSLNARTLL